MATCSKAVSSAWRAKQQSSAPTRRSYRPTSASDLLPPELGLIQMTSIFHGVIPALMTEMKQNGALDHDATSRHIESCVKVGVNGFVMLGTLGENSSLSLDEKEAVVRNAVATVNGRAPIIAGVAEYTTD